MKIYTKSGDKGKTGIHGGQRVYKDDIRIEANGSVDELNSIIGVVRAYLPPDHEWQELFFKIQTEIMIVMSHVATPSDIRSKNPNQLDLDIVSFIESKIDDLVQRMAGGNEYFILPGGNLVSSHLHMARTIARRSERRLWTLNKTDELPAVILQFMNRLSDLFFTMARYELFRQEMPEEKWKLFLYKRKKMSAKKKYSFVIEAHHIDFRRRVSLKSLTNMVLVTAGKNADENGFGLLELQTGHYTWVLSRLVIAMERFPTETDTLTIETWVEHVGTAFTTRNFRLSDGSGTIIGNATSSWAVIDLSTRRSVRLDNVPNIQQFIVNESVPLGGPSRIGRVDGEIANSFTVKYSDIDVNGHANSLNYVQWLSDCFSLDFYRQHFILRFEINFLKEITYHDSGEVRRQMTAPGDYLFQIETREKGVSCRARIMFAANS